MAERNIWAHCDFSSYDLAKFYHSIEVFEEMVHSLRLSAKEEMDIIQRLIEWKKNVNFLWS